MIEFKGSLKAFFKAYPKDKEALMKFTVLFLTMLSPKKKLRQAITLLARLEKRVLRKLKWLPLKLNRF